MKYYYCLDDEIKTWVTSGGVTISQFIITPAEYYDKKGFLSDSFSAVPPCDLPAGFSRCADSRFEFRGTEEAGLSRLLATFGYIRRDMVKEIKEKYLRERPA